MHADGHGTATVSPFLASARIVVFFTLIVRPAPARPGPGPGPGPAPSTVSQLATTSIVSTTAVSVPIPQSMLSASPSRAWMTSLPNGILHEYQEQWELVASP